MVDKERQCCNHATEAQLSHRSNRMGCDDGGTDLKTLFHQTEVTALSSRGNSSYLLNDSLNRGLHK